MKFSSYIVVMASSWMIAAAGVVGFNVAVDALGILPVGVSIPGFNKLRPLREQYDLIVDRVDVERFQPRTIFMGTSRVRQSIDPGVLAGTTFAPAYNGALNGGAHFQEIRWFLQVHFEADKKLRYVYIEAFPTALLQYSDPSMAPKPRAPGSLAAGYVSAVFSMGGLRNSARTVLLNLRDKGGPLDAERHGFVPVPLATHHFSVRNVSNFILYAPVLRRGLRLPPDIVDAATGLINDCKARQVECRFFLSPLHADVLAAIYYLGLWPELEEEKRMLAELAPTYDFTRYNRLIEERIGPVVYWPEAFHFSPAMGELIAKGMTGTRTAQMPENFGVLLDSSNVEQNLAAWREERDQWLAQNPAVVRRMQQADENFRSGIPFKDVTQAAMAAGDW